MSRPTDEQWTSMCDQALTTLTWLRANGPAVLHRDRSGSLGTDGFPTSSGGGGGSRRSTDAEGVSGPGGSDPGDLVYLPSYSDPTGSLAARLADAGETAGDLVRTARVIMVTALRDSLTELRRSEAAVRRVTEQAAPEAAPLGSRPTLLADCGVCEQPAHPIRAGMCVDCHDEWVGSGRPDRVKFTAGRQEALRASRGALRLLAAVTTGQRPPARRTAAAACELCGTTPARVPAFDNRRPVVLCSDACYGAWSRGVRAREAA